MLVRRCHSLFIRVQESLSFDLSLLFAGERALRDQATWSALAGHRDGEVALDAAELALLAACSESLWSEAEVLEQAHDAATLRRLLEEGLLIAHEGPFERHREADQLLRAQYWHPLSAVMHRHSRWLDTQALEDPTLSRYRDIHQMIAELGPPPPASRELPADHARIALPDSDGGGLDPWLLQRFTGRNYDADVKLELGQATRLLQRTFGVQGRHQWSPQAMALKKTSPSGGGLHPIDAFVIARNIEGVPAAVYYYHPEDHALQQRAPLPTPESMADLIAGQQWFVPAAMWVVLVARVGRNFWKYRRHPKALRAITLDAGHLSQTFYLLATEAGMPAFITAAVNEARLEALLGLQPEQDAVIAVCGCGPAAAVRETVEFRVEPIA